MAVICIYIPRHASSSTESFLFQELQEPINELSTEKPSTDSLSTDSTDSESAKKLVETLLETKDSKLAQGWLSVQQYLYVRTLGNNGRRWCEHADMCFVE